VSGPLPRTGAGAALLTGLLLVLPLALILAARALRFRRRMDARARSAFAALSLGSLAILALACAALAAFRGDLAAPVIVELALPAAAVLLLLSAFRRG